jgi:branched-subunit amino acid ABC-type transport system permease component
MNIPLDLLANAVVGISIAFGILDIVNIAHPAFVILGAYAAYLVNAKLGLDPILVSVRQDAAATPAWFLLP